MSQNNYYTPGQGGAPTGYAGPPPPHTNAPPSYNPQNPYNHPPPSTFTPTPSYNPQNPTFTPGAPPATGSAPTYYNYGQPPTATPTHQPPPMGVQYQPSHNPTHVFTPTPQSYAPPPPPGQYNPQFPGQQGTFSPGVPAPQCGAPGQPLPPTQAVPSNKPAPPRIDPGQIPSPTSVADGRVVKFLTGTGIAVVPPPAATQYVAIDEGNPTPRYMRMSMYCIPANNDLLSTSHIPFAALIQPLAEPGRGENKVPLVDMSAAGGPVRCRRCRGYLNPFNIFVDGGRKFICKLCDCENDVPDAYFSPLEPSGRRHDYQSRPELSCGSIDIIAPSATATTTTTSAVPVLSQQATPTSLLFLIDVSDSSAASGFLQGAICSLKNLLNTCKSTPASSNPALNEETLIGLVTYDTSVHFWNITGTLPQAQMLVVTDLTNLFVPLGSGLVVPLAKSFDVLNALLDKLPNMFGTRAIGPVAYTAAVEACSLLAQTQQAGGGARVISFLAASSEVNTNNKKRDDLKLVGTDKERILYGVRDSNLKNLGAMCAKRMTAVDLITVAPQQDMASLAAVTSTSGGKLHYLPSFTPRDSASLSALVLRSAQRDYGYDGVAHVRTSRGITVSEYLGGPTMTSAKDIELPFVHSETCLAVCLKHDDKLDDKTEPLIQFAMLYTSPNGQKRIRVHTMKLSCSTTLGNVFRSADLDAISNMFARIAAKEMMQAGLAYVRGLLQDKCVEILSAYRKHCASSSAPGQLILPESLKLLPIYTLSIMKNFLLRNTGDVVPDDRIAPLHFFNTSSPSLTTPYFYPRCIPLHKLSNEESDSKSGQLVPGDADPEGRTNLPTPIRLSTEYLEAEGFYLIENGQEIFLWLGRNAPAHFAEYAAAVDGTAEIQTQHPVYTRIENVIRAVYTQRCKGAVLRTVRPRELLETKLIGWLVEDKLGDHMSYVDFLCHVHKLIQGRLA
eukprot:TRINITY_DN5852_c0_g1_i1.p1 TRINITY_DN5852_c0_g1~~TRINITY_DN5852_c0_g1_i1.p1  ORF type:complete len:955 (-),score=284.07 TRINITY_DN5852_c0_g1_i1:89-2953(-)